MRKRLILIGVGILTTAAWPVTLDAGAPGHGPKAASPDYNGLVVYPRYIQYHTRNIGGLIFPVQLEINPSLFPGLPDLAPTAPDMSAGGASVAGPGAMVGDHHGGPASHLHPHVAVPGEQGTALIPQATADRAAESDQAVAATAQPNPTASPLAPRPPGATGPGRRVSGTFGPGLPGPGRRVSPRW